MVKEKEFFNNLTPSQGHVVLGDGKLHYLFMALALLHVRLIKIQYKLKMSVTYLN
jgi:hypothetical protein